MDITARVPSQRTSTVDSLDLWCLLCMLRFEECGQAVDAADLAAVEAGEWKPSREEVRLLAAQPGDLGWAELALGPLMDGLVERYPGWEGEILIHLAGVLAARELRLRVALRSEWTHDGDRRILALAGEGFPNAQAIQWRPHPVRS